MGGVIQNTLPATLTEKLAGHSDTATGLQYDGARYYDPWVGSFIQPSPFGWMPEAPQSLNRFGLAAESIPAYVLAQYEPGSVSPLAVDAGKLAVLKSVSKGLLANPLVQFGLNKALISTVWEEPLPEGLIKYRLARQVMPWAKRHIPDFRWGKRAIAGGTGNAIISAGITFIGGAAIASTCVGTGPACPLALGALTLTADFTANLAFDVRLKDPFLERVGLGRKWYKE